MTDWIRLICLTCLLGLSPLSARAHEVNPAYLELTEVSEQEFEVTWKQPLKDGRRLRLVPVFPDECERSSDALRAAASAVIESWTLTCNLREGELRIDGLQRTLTDVFVQISYLNGERVSVLLRPGRPSFSLATQERGAPLLAYFTLGVEHILFGYDHLLFVLGVCLLVRAKQLLPAVTAFTIAHSITLAMATLGNVALPGPPVEAVIALSLVLLARESLTFMQGDQSLTSQHPWLVTFGFGLIHGFGFADALSEIGLPDQQEAWALLLFNLGVETGQIMFVLGVAVLAVITIRFARNLERTLKTSTAYGIGIAGTYWTIERLATF